MVALGAAFLLCLLRGCKVFLGRRRDRPLVGLHFVLDLAGLEGLVLMLRGLPDDRAAATGAPGVTSVLIAAAAMLTGLPGPILALGRPPTHWRR